MSGWPALSGRSSSTPNHSSSIGTWHLPGPSAEHHAEHTDVRRRLLLQEELFEFGSGGPGVVLYSGDQDLRMASRRIGETELDPVLSDHCLEGVYEVVERPGNHGAPKTFNCHRVWCF